MATRADEKTLREPAEGLGAWTLRDHRRNGAFVDWWSLTHVAWAAALTLVVGPLWAFLLMAVWEPLEIFVISPLLWRKGLQFGYESWQNAVGDLVFDGVGVLVGAYLVLPYWNPLGV